MTHQVWSLEISKLLGRGREFTDIIFGWGNLIKNPVKEFEESVNPLHFNSALNTEYLGANNNHC